jgi:hypothetical protein
MNPMKLLSRLSLFCFLVGLLLFPMTIARGSPEVQSMGGRSMWIIRPDGSDETFLVESATSPTWSPNSGSIAFVSDRDGTPDIYVLDLESRSVSRLTDQPGSEREPAWSPDGEHIAFVYEGESVTSSPEIHIMQADGAAPTLLYKNWVEVGPAWSPDGSLLALQHASSIYIINVEDALQSSGTSGRVGLAICPANDCEYKQPAWSPNGRDLAMVSNRDGDLEIYLLNVDDLMQGFDGSLDRRLTDNDAGDMEPCWSPDGTQIAFISNRNGSPQLHIMNADGSDVTRLTYSDGWDGEPAWSPDGAWIAFSSMRAVPPAPTETLPAAAAPIVEATPAAEHALAPAIAPEPDAPSGGDNWLDVLAVILILGGGLGLGALFIMRRFSRVRSFLAKLASGGDTLAEQETHETHQKKPPMLQFTSPGGEADLPPWDFRIVVAYQVGDAPLDLKSLEITCDRSLGDGTRARGDNLADLFHIGPNQATWKVPQSLAFPEGKVVLMASISDQAKKLALEALRCRVTTRYLFGIDPKCSERKTGCDAGPVQIEPGATLEIYGLKLRESPADKILASFPSSDEEMEEWVPLEFSGEENNRAQVTLRKRISPHVVGESTLIQHGKPLPIVSGSVSLYDEARDISLPGQVEVRVSPQPTEVRLDYFQKRITVVGEGLDRHTAITLQNHRGESYKNSGPARWERGERAVTLPLERCSGIPDAAIIKTQGGTDLCMNIVRPQLQIDPPCWHEAAGVFEAQVSGERAAFSQDIEGTSITTEVGGVTFGDMRCVKGKTLQVQVKVDFVAERGPCHMTIQRKLTPELEETETVLLRLDRPAVSIEGPSHIVTVFEDKIEDARYRLEVQPSAYSAHAENTYDWHAERPDGKYLSADVDSNHQGIRISTADPGRILLSVSCRLHELHCNHWTSVVAVRDIQVIKRAPTEEEVAQRKAEQERAYKQELIEQLRKEAEERQQHVESLKEIQLIMSGDPLGLMEKLKAESFAFVPGGKDLPTITNDPDIFEALLRNEERKFSLWMDDALRTMDYLLRSPDED